MLSTLVLSSGKSFVCGDSRLQKLGILMPSSSLLDKSLSMRFSVKADMIENINVKVTSDTGERMVTANDIEFISDGCYYIYFRNFDASEMDKTFYFTVYDGDVAVSDTISYSIESFVAQKINEEDTSLNSVLVSMMRFGDSAKKYVNS